MDDKPKINLDDFRFLRRGQQLSIVNKKDAGLLSQITIHQAKSESQKQRALLLVHGFSSSPAVFRALLPSFSDYDAVVAPVLPGHAANLDAFAAVKARDWLLTVEESYLSLKQEFRQVDVMGLSLGGILACHLSARFQLDHLYLLAPALDLHLAINKIILLARGLHWLGFKKVRSLAGDLFTSDFCEIAYRQLPLTTIIEILTFINRFEFSMPSCPTDVFLGRHDNVVASEHVAERFANEASIRVHWLDNSAHVLPLDGDIAKIIACVKKNGSI